MRYTLLACCAALAGCVTVENELAGPVKDESIHIDRGKAEQIRMEVRMGVGELRVADGAPAGKLVDANFRYNVPFLKPTVDYNDSSFRGSLIIEQRGEKKVRIGSDMENKWDLKLDREIPLDLEVKLGVGETKLDLGKLNLRGVRLNVGVGECRMDLRGDPQRDYDVEIHGGVGEATIYLPANVGVAATAKGGIGSVRVEGLTEENGRYVNKNYGKAKVTVRVDVRGGVGEIKLIG
ncbi:MAG: toast rack family protein [Bryobacteraceae bacterium]|nr:toast rack family protein [Bryobacteraceae bacterium]